MDKIKGCLMMAAMYVCLFIIWAVVGLEVLDDD